jgi:hypothetical protein
MSNSPFGTAKKFVRDSTSPGVIYLRSSIFSSFFLTKSLTSALVLLAGVLSSEEVLVESKQALYLGS